MMVDGKNLSAVLCGGNIDWLEKCNGRKYDVVHIHAEGPAFFEWLPKMFGKKVVVTIHGECEIIWTTREKPGFMRGCAA